MPGSNEYSMAPELRASETTPTLVSKTASSTEKKDTGLPQIYKTQVYDPTTFDQAAFDAAYLKQKHGTDASKRDIRRFNNKFKSSEEYAKALADAKAEAKANFDAAERQKWSDSYRAYSTALAAQHKAKVGASTQTLKEDIAKLDMNPQLKPKWSATNASVDNGATTYKVQAGNTLGQIVADYNKKNPGANLKWQDVAKWSGITDPSKMKIGHVINFADPTQAPAAETAATPVQPTPVAPQNPVVTPTDTVAVTAPRDTTQLAVPGDTTKVSAVDSTALATPVDTTGVTSPVDTTQTSSPVVFYNPQKRAFDLHGLYKSRGWQPLTIKTDYQPRFNKQGGTMNRINYFQQGGAAPQQQDLQQQIIALVQAAMQGDQKATETVNKIMEAAKAGDQQAVQLAQMIQQVVEQMKGQATAAKWGAKLGYIRSLKYAKGGKACPACEKGKQIEMKACGGKKAKKTKKRYFGGLI